MKRSAATSIRRNNHAFKSGATSSEHKVPIDQLYQGAIRRIAARFGLGIKKHGRGNYLRSVAVPRKPDVEFLRDRYSHAIDHLLSVKEEGSVPFHEDLDHLAAVGWFLFAAMEMEEKYQINWQDILKMTTPEAEHGKSRRK